MTHEEAVAYWTTVKQRTAWVTVPGAAAGHYAAAIAAQGGATGMLDILARHTPDHGAAYVEPNGGATMTPCEGCLDDWPCPDARACAVTS